MNRETGFRDEVRESINARFAGRPAVGFMEAARILGMCTKTLRHHILRREIEYFQIGFGKVKRRRVFTVEDLVSFIERRRVLEHAAHADMMSRRGQLGRA